MTFNGRDTLVARLLLAASAFAAGWACLLGATGGFRVSAFGLTFSAHNAVRPLVVSSLALAAYLMVAPRQVRGLPLLQLSRARGRALAATLAVVLGIVAFVYGAKVAGGADSFGYLSEADLWLSGHLSVDQAFASEAPWPAALQTFTPVAFRPNDADGTIRPVYPSGLPLMFAAAKGIGGQNAMFAVVPIFGGLLIVATFGIGVRIASPLAGLIGAWLVATSPIVLYMSMVAMSDIPAAALVAAAVYLLMGTSIGNAFGSGLLIGTAVLVRPTLAIVVPVMAARFCPGLLSGHTRTDTVRRAVAFVAGVLPPALAAGLINRALYGSPWATGYGTLEGFFSPAHILPNVVLNAGWFSETQTMFGYVGLVALFVSTRRVWSPAEPVLLVVIRLFVLALAAFYFVYTVFDSWTYLRFLLPIWPFVMVGIGAVAAWLVSGRGRVVAAVVLTLALGLGLAQFDLARTYGAFGVWRFERRFIEVGRMVNRLTPQDSVILSMQHSGSLRYYGGRMTLRYDWLEPTWADRALAWLASRRSPAYLVVDTTEIPAVEERFAGTRIETALSRQPRAVFGQPPAVLLFDLSDPSDHSAAPIVVTAIDSGVWAVEPAPAPRQPFTR